MGFKVQKRGVDGNIADTYQGSNELQDAVLACLESMRMLIPVYSQ
jgi:hypothetical protein